jgi:prepilin-type N-terminal cleavage/methylation domain-containing protein
MGLFTPYSIKRDKRGFGLIEIVIVIAIVSVAVVAFGEVARLSLSALQREKRAFEASLLVEEGFEAMRGLRDQSWNTNISTLSNTTNYYLATTTSASTIVWNLSTTQPTRLINGTYWRTIVLGSVNRDSGDRIAVSGSIDSGTRQITITVSWRDKNATTSVSSVGYLTNFLQN